MSVIRRGLLALILVAPMALAASVASTPSSHADASCNGAGASTGGAMIQTYVCLTLDTAPATAKPLSTGSSDGGPPLVCWLEPQYSPQGLQDLITTDANLPVSVVGEGGPLYAAWKTNYGGLTPPYHNPGNGWWWGVGCDITNLNASTVEQQIWSEIPGMDVYHPWEWVPNQTAPTAPADVVVANAGMLALYAREAAPLDEPSAQMSPKYTAGASTQTVGLPTYFWGQIGPTTAGPVAQHTIEATVQFLSSGVVTAIPETVTVTTTGTVKGDNPMKCPVTTGSFGTAYASGIAMPADCSFTYTQPSNDVTLTMVTNWKITWAGKDGYPGWTVDEDSIPVTLGGIKVQEVQTINN